MNEPVINWAWVRKPFCFLFTFFLAFPFLQLIPLSSYNQPYALLIACLVFPLALLSFLHIAPGWHSLCLISFPVIGILLFLTTCFPYSSPQEYKYLYSYIGFPIVAVSAFYFIRHERPLVINILKKSIYIWLLVALVQYYIKSDFMLSFTGLPSHTTANVVASGRGVVSMAPEPTHYGFHILVIGSALALLGAGWRTLALCIVQAVFLAKSASAVLALCCAIALVTIIGRKINFRTAILLSASTVLATALMLIIASQSRMVILATEFINSPMEILHRDYSLNIRLGGLFASLQHIFDNWLLPQGLSHSAWLTSAEQIRMDNKWLMDISSVGPPSGILVILYQAGFMILPQILFLVATFLLVPIKGFKAILVYCVPVIILGQYYIASPPFALAYVAAILYRQNTMRSRPPLIGSQRTLLRAI